MVEYCDTPPIERVEQQGTQSIPKRRDHIMPTRPVKTFWNNSPNAKILGKNLAWFILVCFWVTGRTLIATRKGLDECSVREGQRRAGQFRENRV